MSMMTNTSNKKILEMQKKFHDSGQLTLSLIYNHISFGIVWSIEMIKKGKELTSLREFRAIGNSYVRAAHEILVVY